MKTTTLLLALAALFLALIPTAAHAGMFCEEPNLFALTFDPGGNMINMGGMEPFSAANMYLYLLNPESNCMNGFELEIIVPEDIQVLSTTFPGNTINIGSGTNFIVGFQFPHPATENRILLCTLSVLNMNADGDVQDFYMAPAEPASIEGSMAFLNCSEIIVPANPISLDYSLPLSLIHI